MNDDIRLKGFKQFTPIDEVLALLDKKIKIMPIEKIKTISALGRIIASDVISPIDLPHFPRSAMDGYAVRSKDTFGASLRAPKHFKIIDKIKINETSNKIVKENEAVQIPTGGPVPEGADSVIKFEDTKKNDDYIEVYFPISPFKNVAKKGEDVKKDEIIISKGTIIRPQELTLLLACNILEIEVYKKPRVAIVPTGSELVEIGEKPKIGQIIETNSYSIASLCQIYGADPTRLGIIKDDEKLLADILEQALKYDIIIFTGGSSVGEYDLIPYLIKNRNDSEILAHGISMRPGSPTAIAIVRDKPVFCLSGYPVAAMIGFETFIGHTIRKMMNAKRLDPRPFVKAVLKRQIPSRLGRRDFVRVKLTFDKEQKKFFAEPIRSSGSGIISSVVRASGIIEISEDLEGIDKNEEVIVKLYLPR